MEVRTLKLQMEQVMAENTRMSKLLRRQRLEVTKDKENMGRRGSIEERRSSLGKSKQSRTDTFQFSQKVGQLRRVAEGYRGEGQPRPEE